MNNKEWFYEEYGTINSLVDISSINSKAIGFTYVIEFIDGTKYVGKKNLYSKQKLKILKSGEKRKGHQCFIQKNTGNSNRDIYEIIKKESNWLQYKGSHIDCKNKKVLKKYIIDFATSKLELTYLEAKLQFNLDVLRDKTYINDNILGKFYKSNL